MKRINVESGINITISDKGKIPNKCFEVVRVRTKPKFKDAICLFKYLRDFYKCVYIYEVKAGFMVEFKTYTDNLITAREIKAEVEAKLEVFENEA